jgi:hypothetical protein
MASTQPIAPAASLETPLPSAQVLIQAARLAQQLDKPIQLDYYADSIAKKAVIGEDQETKEKIIIKNNEEYTSLIKKIYKVADDYIVMTENSIYIISTKIEKRKIQTSQLISNE